MYWHSKYVEQKIKQVTSVGLSLFDYQDDARSNKHNIQFIDLVNMTTSNKKLQVIDAWIIAAM